MDKKLQAESVSLVLLFAAFPLTSIGKMGNTQFIWWIGLLCLIAGGLLPIVTRFMDHTADTVRDVGIEYDDRTS